MPRRMKNRLAYYWSFVGEIIFSTLKSFRLFSPDPLLGTLDGIAVVLRHDEIESATENIRHL